LTVSFPFSEFTPLLESARVLLPGVIVKFRFADCTLDDSARTLARRGRGVHLAPKAFELLHLLLEHRPRALSKAELLERVWPGVFVSDASLAKVVSQIRQAIGDDDASPAVRTVHGYGYAFAGAIEGAADEPAQGRPVCWLFCGAREFPLREGEHIVGREPAAAVCLESPKVSRRHARLIVTATGATLEDLGSKNGSFVRGIRITGPTALESGDEACFGPFRLLFRVAGDSGSTLSERR
jgi:DNA-binding winged helix-turn-helix (wHTH) protein